MVSYTLIACAVIFALSAAAGLSLLTLKYPPTWAEEFGTKKQWLAVTIFALTVATVAVGAITFGALEASIYSFWQLLTALTAVSTGAMVTVIAAFTDSKLRKVDRRLINRASLVTLLPLMGLLITSGINLGTYIGLGFVLLGLVVYFLIMSIGASDARALIFVGVAFMPLIGSGGLIVGSGILSILALVLSLGGAIVTGGFKATLPAVPLLVAPYWLVLLFVGITNYGVLAAA